MPGRDLKDVIKRVIQFTLKMNVERDFWRKASAISGVLACGTPRDIAAVQGWMERAIETQRSDGSLNYGETEDYGTGHSAILTQTGTLSAALGYPLLQFYERTKNKRYLEAAGRQAQAVLRAPRTKDGGFWARMEGPELWIDWIYMICPFLAKYGKITHEPKYVNEAYKQHAVHVKRLVCPVEHLARHAWRELPNSFPQSTFWARGNGWLTAGTLQLREAAPEHPKCDKATAVAIKTLAKIAQLQDRSGYLHHILDDPYSKFESSATLMFAYSTARAVKMGLMGKSYLEQAVRAVTVVAGEVDAEGGVQGTAVPPGGPGVPFATAPYGQGFFLLACDALRKELKL